MTLMASRPATRIVFDLDGTLVQTRISSWEVFRDVQAEFGLGIDTAEEFFSHFEGNFFASLRAHCPDEKTADAVIARFFARLEADYRPALVPGMADVVHALAGSATLAVLSSNATSVIRRVLDDNGLQFCFAHVFGGDVEPDKGAGLRRYLADAAQGVGRRCAPAFDEGGEEVAVAAGDTVLVTDTVGDTEAAIAEGVRVVGVSWGMHSADRLRAAGAEFVAVWPQEIIAYLLPFAGGDACAVGGRPTGALPVSHAAIRRDRRLAASRPAAPSHPAEAACGCTAVGVDAAAATVPAAPVSATRGDSGRELEAAMRAIVRAI